MGENATGCINLNYPGGLPEDLKMVDVDENEFLPKFTSGINAH